MRLLPLLLLATPLLACGSSVQNESPSDGGGGTGGSLCAGADCAPGCPATPPTADTDCDLSDFASCDYACDGVFECQPVYPEAGAPSRWTKVSNGACCPDAAPEHGAVCDGDLLCNYNHSPLGVACPSDIEASCVDGHWNSLKPASCGPATACDPTGDYSFAFGAWSDGDPMGATTPSGITLALDADGTVVSSAPQALYTDTGCTLEAVWSDEDCETIDGQQFCTYKTFTAEIDFTLEPPAGTMSYTCEGECGQTTSATLTLQGQ